MAQAVMLAKKTTGQHLPSSRQLGEVVVVVVLQVTDSWGISSAVLVGSDYHTNNIGPI